MKRDLTDPTANGSRARDGAHSTTRMDRAPTSRDVAALAGVSQPTVSRALRGDHGVSEATRNRVVSAAARLGYIPSERGRSLSTRRTRRVGIVIADLTDPFYMGLMNKLNEELDPKGVRLLFHGFTHDAEELLERLLDGSIDGAFLVTTDLGSILPHELHRRRFPFVLVHREVDGIKADACVVDNAQGAALVAAELVRLGHRRIGAILGPESTSTGRAREAGFRRALADLGIPLPRTMVHSGAFHFDTGLAGLPELMALPERPTAVFCANDAIAHGVLNAARTLGLRVPEDLSVIGFDDMGASAWPVFQLTTVRWDLAQMARIATDMLLNRIGDLDRPVARVVLPAGLALRATHARVPADR